MERQLSPSHADKGPRGFARNRNFFDCQKVGLREHLGYSRPGGYIPRVEIMFHAYKILPRVSPHQGSSRFTNAVSHHSLVTMLADSLNLALRNQGTSRRAGSQWDALPASSCPEVCAITGMRCGAALLGIMGERQESRASYSHGCAAALFPQQKCCAATLHIRVASAGDSAGRAAIALATSSSAPRATNSSTTASSPR